MRSSSIVTGVFAALPLVSAWVSPHAHRQRLANRQAAAPKQVEERGPLRRSDLQYYNNKTSGKWTLSIHFSSLILTKCAFRCRLLC